LGSVAKVGDYAKRLDNLNKKKSIFLTPLNCDLNAFIEPRIKFGIDTTQSTSNIVNGFNHWSAMYNDNTYLKVETLGNILKFCFNFRVSRFLMSYVLKFISLYVRFVNLSCVQESFSILAK
jgi:hypothetical protein